MLCSWCYLSHQVFLLGQWQVTACDINPSAILSLSAAMWKIKLTALPILLSAPSSPAACRMSFTDYTAFTYPVMVTCLLWFHMLMAVDHREDSTPFTPPDAANHHPVPKPLRATGSRKIQHLRWVATPTLRCCHVMFKVKAAASHALSQ